MSSILGTRPTRIALFSGTLVLLSLGASASQDGVPAQVPVVPTLPDTLAEMLAKAKEGGPAVWLLSSERDHRLMEQVEVTIRTSQEVIALHYELLRDQERLDRAEERVRLVVAQHESGIVSTEEVLTAQGERAEVVRDLEITKAGLLHLTGGGEDADATLPETLEELLLAIVDKNPELELARARLRVAELEVEVARREGLRDVRCRFQERAALEESEHSLRLLRERTETRVASGVASREELLDVQSKLLEIGAEKARVESKLCYLLGLGVWEP